MRQAIWYAIALVAVIIIVFTIFNRFSNRAEIKKEVEQHLKEMPVQPNYVCPNGECKG